MSTDGQAGTPGPEAGRTLEEGKRLSDSLLFQINRQYYDESGPNAWNSGAVPSYATCNAFIAHAYASVVLAYLRDLRSAGQLDEKEPVYIVELAAGVGRFAHGFLNHLHALKSASSLAGLDVRYVMTDFTMTNLRAWRGQPRFEARLRSGELDLGTFDVDKDHEIRLVSGRVLSAETIKNPLVVLGNYAFDTFTHDLFRVSGGEFHEVLLTIRLPAGEAFDLRRTDVISRLQVQYNPRPARAEYYPDPALNQVLARYRERLAEAMFLMPIGGLTGLRSLIELSGRRLLLLSSDKGFTHEDELYHPAPHSMQFHTGCLSMMVNYHAVGEYFLALGGQYAATSRRLANLKTAMCALGSEPAALADTFAVFRERIDVFGPSDFYELLQAEKQDLRTISVEHFLSLLRLSQYDPGLVLEHAGPVMNQAGTLPEPSQLELRVALERAWENFFPGPQNLPFELARIFLAMRRPKEGLRFNRYAVELYGENAPTLLNMGICHYHAESPEEAARCFQRALELRPGFGMAKAWLARLAAEAERSEGLSAVPARGPRPTYELPPA